MDVQHLHLTLVHFLSVTNVTVIARSSIFVGDISCCSFVLWRHIQGCPPDGEDTTQR